VQKYAAKQKDMIFPEKGKHSLVNAQATIDVNLIQEKTRPTLNVLSNHMEILHSGLKDKLDHRSLMQRIIDYFTNLFTKICDIAPAKPDKSLEKMVMHTSTLSRGSDQTFIFHR
jgi:hypothetical protein